MCVGFFYIYFFFGERFGFWEYVFRWVEEWGGREVSDIGEEIFKERFLVVKEGERIRRFG